MVGSFGDASENPSFTATGDGSFFAESEKPGYELDSRIPAPGPPNTRGGSDAQPGALNSAVAGFRGPRARRDQKDNKDVRLPGFPYYDGAENVNFLVFFEDSRSSRSRI